ncbi:hypothetical protein [Streptomyces sp. NPDC001601]|uniref:hypothetical protein n=1 Tax=Streptomyces sp. NPDC001601 TaxID=3364592 RepID=UPI0036C477AD
MWTIPPGPPRARPATSPARTAEDVADLIEALRRRTKHGPARLAADLRRLHGITVAPAPPSTASSYATDSIGCATWTRPTASSCAR